MKQEWVALIKWSTYILQIDFAFVHTSLVLMQIQIYCCKLVTLWISHDTASEISYNLFH
jgi:hypothetical protein